MKLKKKNKFGLKLLQEFLTLKPITKRKTLYLHCKTRCMKMRKLLCVFSFLLLFQASSFAQGFTNQPAKPIKFEVEVKDVNGFVSGAFVELLIDGNTVARGATNDNGRARLVLEEYRKQYTIVRVTVPGYKQKELRNLVLEHDVIYPLTINEGTGLEFDIAKPVEVVPVAATPGGGVSKSEVKKKKKEAKNAAKKEEAYRKELAEIRKEQNEIESTRGRLERLQKELNEEIKNGSVSQKSAEARKREIDTHMRKMEEDEKKIKERLQALNKKYGKS
jgi:hypothetical protein